MIDFTVSIMAGGKSSRMGTDKSFVPLLGKPMIEHIIERTANLGQRETQLITNQPDRYRDAHLGLPMRGDLHPDKGPLGGIYTALYYSASPYTLVIGCDMPFINPALLRYMIELGAEDSFDVIVPRVEKYPQGLHAIYGKQCIEPIRQKLQSERLKVIGFYDDVRVHYLDEEEYLPLNPDGLSMHNVNTPTELEEAQRLAEKFR